MEQHKVVPDIIPEVPPNVATVQYSDKSVNLGNELTPTQVHDMPDVTWPYEESAYYTLIMNDPDVPPNIAKEVQHWMVVNIPGNNISEGKTLFKYVGSGPPKGTGLHRYIFLIYKQETFFGVEKYNDIKDENIQSRRLHQLKDITERLALKNLVAGNFYLAQYDDNVPIYAEERRKAYEKKL